MLKVALIRRLSRRFQSTSERLGSDRVDTVGVLCLHDQSPEMENLKIELEKLGKSPRIVSFISHFDKKKAYPKNTFSSKDIGITGNILSAELEYFVKQQYDYVLCLDRTGNDFIRYLLSKTVAQHRIGFYHSSFEGLLDMMIKTDHQHSPIQELIRYMNMIRND